MKRLISLFLSVVFVLSCLLPLSACSETSEDWEEVVFKERFGTLICYDQVYVSLKNDWNIVYCGDSSILYSAKTWGPGTDTGVRTKNCQVFASENNDVLAVVQNKDGAKNAADFWGVESLNFYVAKDQNKVYDLFFSVSNPSYRLLCLDSETPFYYELGGKLEEGNYLMEAWRDTRALTLNEHTYYPIVECDTTGTFGKIIGYIVEFPIYDQLLYYYVDARLHSELFAPQKSEIQVSGVRLSGSGEKAFLELKENGNRISPQFSQGDSLYQHFYEAEKENLTLLVIQVAILVLLCTVLIILCVVILFLLFGRKVLRWIGTPFVYVGRGFAWLGKGIVRIFRRIRQRKKLSNTVNDDDETLHIKLTKEELTRTLVEETEEDGFSEEGVLRYCPRCGAKCDWSSLRCAACGVSLSVQGGPKPVRYEGGNDAAAERNIGPEGVLLDLNRISREEYIEKYSPRRLKKSLKGRIIDYYAIVAWYALGNLLVSGELIGLTQSFLVGVLSFVGIFVLLGFAVRYHKKQDLTSAIVVTVVSFLETGSFLMGFGSIIDYYPVGVLVFTFFFGVLPFIASLFILIAAIQLEKGYREFRKGNLYQ